jgi:hypothetical protein
MIKNNTKTLTIVAIFMIATLVVGASLTSTITPSALAGGGGKKVKQDKYMRGATGQDGIKKGTGDNQTRDGGNGGSGNENSNTVTALAAQNKGFASGFDTTTDQEAQNLICTHPGNNAACAQEGAVLEQQQNATTNLCVECFTNLLSQGLISQEQINTILDSLGATSLADLCIMLEHGEISNEAFNLALGKAGIGEGGGIPLIKCLQSLGINVGGE